jgi:hypothetical protein
MVYYTTVCVRTLALEQVAPSNVNNISLWIASARPQREKCKRTQQQLFFFFDSVQHVSVHRTAIVLKKNKASVLRHFIFTFFDEIKK